MENQTVVQNHSTAHLVTNVFLTIFIPPITFIFALWFPFTYDPAAKNEYYVSASYVYDPINTRFDNSPWTYVTDYIICLWMTFGCVSMRNLGKKCPAKNSRGIEVKNICNDTCILLGLYAVSVLAGGYCHQFFKGSEQMNSWVFRLLWTITVGSVTYAGTYIGLIGTSFLNILRINNEKICEKKRTNMKDVRSSLILKRWFWHAFGMYLTVMCAIGGMSYKRPAADIFIAGTSQFVPSVYAVIGAMLAFLQTKKEHRHFHSFPKYAIVLYITGFFLNVPLLPGYPMLLRSNLKLGTVNAIMHVTLSISWGMQFLAIYWYCNVNRSTKIKD